MAGQAERRELPAETVRPRIARETKQMTPPAATKTDREGRQWGGKRLQWAETPGETRVSGEAEYEGD